MKLRPFALASIASLLALSVISACSNSNNDSNPSSADSKVAGRLANVNVSSVAMKGGVRVMTAKTITHVMAVNPSTSNPQRYVAAVSSDGSFSLDLKSGVPYVIVFIAQNGTLTGPDMIVGTVNVSANGLDTLAIAKAAEVSLGTVTVDGSDADSTANATMSTSVSDLLTTLGISSAEATFIGTVDDLALRLANPDVDNNGVIDASEGKSFGMDWHIRANTLLSTNPMVLADITNQFANEANLTLDWTLGSGYAVYPKSFDDIDYVANSGVSTTLQNGGAFAQTGSAVNATSMSGGTYGDMRQWGPDYNMSSQQLGASDAAAKFTYTLGSSSKQLIYSNVRTKTKAQLNAEGVVLPFVKINESGGKITGVDFKWMKKSGSTWTQATAGEVGLLVQSSGAYMTMYTQKDNSGSSGLSFSIPATAATGTILVSDSSVNASGSVTDKANVSLSSVCSMALSYDDKMGLRIFAGAPTFSGGSACN